MDSIIRRAIRYHARITGRRYPADLYAEMYQQAALRMVECGPSADAQQLRRAALAGVQQAYYADIKAAQAYRALLDGRNAIDKGPLAADIQAALCRLFADGRRKGGDRGRRAAERDATICDLLHQGYSDEGICLEMGIPYVSLREYRKLIKNRLREALNAQRNSAILEASPKTDQPA